MKEQADISYEKLSYQRTEVNGLTYKSYGGHNMNKVGTYDTYVNNYGNYDASAQTGAQKMAAQKTNEAASAKPVELSRDAKNLLKELQQKYGNMDFIIGEFATADEAASYLARGTKDYSVLMSAEELEKMAKDKNAKQEGMDKIESARNQLAYLQTQLKESGENVKRMGVTFEKDGTTTLFASLEKSGEQLKERQEAAKEAKKAEKNGAGNPMYNRIKETTVTAKTTEELLEKIRNVDWENVEEKTVPAAGSRFDYFG